MLRLFVAQTAALTILYTCKQKFVSVVSKSGSCTEKVVISCVLGGKDKVGERLNKFR